MNRCIPLSLTAVAPLAIMAVSAPTLVTWQLNPYAQTSKNVIASIERVTPTVDGGLVVHVGFDRAPSQAPTVQFVYSTKNSSGPTSGGAITQLADGSACTFPTQSMTVNNRWIYAYTLPATPAITIAPNRLAIVRRCRFGGLTYSGKRLEGGGYAIVTSDGIYMGRSGTWSIGGQSMTFSGGVLLEPTSPTAQTTTATYSLRSRARAVTPPNTPTLINGKRMSFPIKEAAK